MPFLRTQPAQNGPAKRAFSRRAKWNPLRPAMRNSLGNVELTFLGHTLESLGRAFDPVLTVIAVGRQQPDHLIGAAGGRTRDIAGSKIDGLSNGEFVLQRLLHHAKTLAALTVPLQRPD